MASASRGTTTNCWTLARTSHLPSSLVNENSMYLPSHGDNKYDHWIILVWNHVFQVRACEVEIELWWMVMPPCLQRHHYSRVSLTFGSRAPSFRESSWDGVNSPLIGISCTWSLRATSPFGSSWSDSRYSFKNPSFTKLGSWWPRAMHRSTSCPNPLWNLHQTSFRNPIFLSVFWGNFSLSTTSSMPRNSL